MYAIQKTVMTLLLLACTAAFATVSVAGDDNASKATPMKFVGTYYSSGGGLASFHADGTMSAVDSNMFSDDPTTSFQGRKTTSSRGVWRAIGNNTIRITAIRFLTEPFGHNYDPDGVIVKTSWEAVFDKPVQGKSPGYKAGTILAEVFLPDQNPLTDEPVLTLEFPGSEGAFRLEVD